jgi:hypothetical protein
MRFIDVNEEGTNKFDEPFSFAKIADMYDEIRTLGDAMRVLLNLWFIFNILLVPPEKIAYSY